MMEQFAGLVSENACLYHFWDGSAGGRAVGTQSSLNYTLLILVCSQFLNFNKCICCDLF